MKQEIKNKFIGMLKELTLQMILVRVITRMARVGHSLYGSIHIMVEFPKLEQICLFPVKCSCHQ